MKSQTVVPLGVFWGAGMMVEVLKQAGTWHNSSEVLKMPVITRDSWWAQSRVLRSVSWKACWHLSEGCRGLSLRYRRRGPLRWAVVQRPGPLLNQGAGAGAHSNCWYQTWKHPNQHCPNAVMLKLNSLILDYSLSYCNIIHTIHTSSTIQYLNNAQYTCLQHG